MKILLFVLILVTIWTQAGADDPHPGTPAPAPDPVTITNTNTETTHVLNLDTSQAAAAMAAGLHQFDASTDDLQVSFSGATIDGTAAGSAGVAMRFNKKALVSGVVSVTEGGEVSGGGAVTIKF